jgi:phospholipid transport system substrate-binding protein
MRKTILTLLVAGAALLFSSSALASQHTDAVRGKQKTLFKVVATPKTPARQRKLEGLFDQMLAYDSMARSSMGKKWGDLSAAEQKQFSALLTRLIRGNYKRNLRTMLSYNIAYVGEKSGKKTTTVKTLAKHKTDKREPSIEIDFRVAKVGGKLMVVDIVTERASMVKTYRSQFLRILRKKSFDKLIEKMEKKLAKMDAEA